MDGQRSRFNPPEALCREPGLQLEGTTLKVPLPLLNSTQARYTCPPTTSESAPPSVAEAHDVLSSKIQYKYTTRNNRKGRHALVVARTEPDDCQLVSTPQPTNRPNAVAHGILRMFTYFPYWDISWLVAVTFTVGSAVWVINAFFTLLPLKWSSTEFFGEILYGGGITAFIGVNIFEVGSVFLMLEAFNTHRSGRFGWAVEQLIENHDFPDTVEGRGAVIKVKPDRIACRPYRANRKAVSESAETGKRRTSVEVYGATPGRGDSWVWLPSSQEVHNKYIRDLGFWACSIQMAAATVFWISGLTALPGILNQMTKAELDVFYWTPQVIGGFGFVVSGMLFMVETQEHWWMPALDVLGWHIGLWNWIGGIGFLLCPCFGYSTAHWAQLQAALSTFWGSWAFLIGSLIQWYESLEKHPVEVRNLHQS